jgi:hypothetical protein
LLIADLSLAAEAKRAAKMVAHNYNKLDVPDNFARDAPICG